ncbi:MAG: TIGR01212 family radical SAM protein [Candidatus Obscuribacterales bacterium]
MTEPYRSFNRYLRDRFGERVYRIPVDAGFTCPNRDGVRAFGGCTFCDDRGSGAPTIDLSVSVREQLEKGMRRIGKRYRARKFLAYYQAFSNTYAPEGVLRTIYDVALEFPEIEGICIGTRPDCLEDNILDLLAEYAEKTFVWLEVGLQSAFDRTLEAINRGHTAGEFFDAVRRARKRDLLLATHLIFGLPGETDEMMLETVRQVAATGGIEGIKIHQLCIYKGTPMEMDYRLGHLPVLDEDRYVRLVADALELIPEDMVVMRLVAEGSQDEIIAPAWAFEKERIMDKIKAELQRRGTRQGARYTPGSKSELAARPV